MNAKQVLAQLKSLGTAQNRKVYRGVHSQDKKAAEAMKTETREP
jgi:hypothetical protein